jgi:hypothetical protein
MIDTFRSLDSNPEIYVGLPPPAFSVQWGINDSTITNDIIPKIQQVAEEKQTPIIDFYAPFADKNELFPDDIHPNNEGNWEMAKVIYKKLTGNEVQEIVDVNVALNKEVLTPKSSAIPGYLVDGDRSTFWPCDVGESVVLDLGSTESIDMVQTFFPEKGLYQYSIEASVDNLDWKTVADKSTIADSVSIGVDGLEATDARYIRFTLTGTEERREFVPIAEIRVLRAAPVHAPVLHYLIDRISKSYVRVNLIITSTISGGSLRCFSASAADAPFNASTGYFPCDADTIRVTIRPDKEKFFYGKFYKGGYEVASDTLMLDYSISAVDNRNAAPAKQYDLGQNYPNPFNPSTNIDFSLPEKMYLELTVYDLLGRTVRRLSTGEKTAGSHRVLWDARDSSGRRVPSGVYIYSLETDLFKATKKLLLIR